MNQSKHLNKVIKQNAIPKPLDSVLAARRDIIDTCTANTGITITGTTITQYSMNAGGTVYGGCLIAPNKICIIPRYGTKISIIDTDNYTVSYPVTGLSQRKYNTCILSGDGNNVYISPCYGAYIGKMPLSTLQIENIGSGYDTSTGYKMIRGVTYQNKTYIFGNGINTSVIIDNNTDSITEFSYKYGDAYNSQQPIRPFLLQDGVYVNTGFRNYKISDTGEVTQQPETGTTTVGLGDFTMGYDGNYYSFCTAWNMTWKLDWDNHTITSYSDILPSPRNPYTYAQLLPTGDIIYYKSGKLYYFKDSNNLGELCSVTPTGDCLLYATNNKLFLVDYSGNTFYEIAITYSQTPRYFKDETLISQINNRG